MNGLNVIVLTDAEVTTLRKAMGKLIGLAETGTEAEQNAVLEYLDLYHYLYTITEGDADVSAEVEG